MFSLTIAILFVFKIRFPYKPVSTILRNRYGQVGLSTFRKYEERIYKYEKAVCHLEFLKCCLTNNLLPKFLNFKLSQGHFRNDGDYLAFQRKLLRKEIDEKLLSRDALLTLKIDSYNDLKNLLSPMDFIFCTSFIDKQKLQLVKRVTRGHDRKLHSLGLSQRFQSLPVESIIFNKSHKILTAAHYEALSLGLKFCFNPIKLNYVKYFSAFEALYRRLSTCKLYASMPDALNFIRAKLKTIA